MNNRSKNRKRSGYKALSSVMTAIMLCAAVLVVGGVVWAYANGSSTIMRNNYFDEVVVRVDQAKERFMIENIFYDDASTISVWIYNYGGLSVNVTVQVLNASGIISSQTGNLISIGEIVQIDVTVSSIYPGDNLIIKVISERENIEYEKYWVN